MAVGRPWWRAKYSNKVWRQFPRQGNPILRTSPGPGLGHLAHLGPLPHLGPLAHLGLGPIWAHWPIWAHCPIWAQGSIYYFWGGGGVFVRASAPFFRGSAPFFKGGGSCLLALLSFWPVIAKRLLDPPGTQMKPKWDPSWPEPPRSKT